MQQTLPSQAPASVRDCAPGATQSRTNPDGTTASRACGCGRCYSTLAEFRELPFGYLINDGYERVEIRTCACNSSIGWVLWVRPDSEAA